MEQKSTTVKCCKTCGAEKPLTEYYADKKNSSGLKSSCKSCYKKAVRNKSRKLKLDLIKYKGGACQRCGGIFHPALYDFHHTDPTVKEGEVTSMKRSDAFKEVDKCILVCAHCHRMEHLHDDWEGWDDKGSITRR